VVIQIRGQMKVPHLLAVRIAHDVAQAPPALDAARTVLRIPDDFVDEIAEVQYETELLGARTTQIFVDHTSIRVACALGYVLAADECEMSRSVVGVGGRGQRSTDTAGVARLLDESIPVLASRLQTRCEKSTGPIGLRSHRHFATRHDVREGGVIRHFHGETMPGRVAIRFAARPENHTIGRWIARCHALRVEIAPLDERPSALARAGLAECKRRTERAGLREKIATTDSAVRCHRDRCALCPAVHAMVFAHAPGLAAVARELPLPDESLVGDVAEAPARAAFRAVIVERDPAVFLAALEHSYGFSNCRDPGDAPLLFVGVIEAQRRPDEAVLARLRELDPEVLQRPAVEQPAHQQLPANLAAR